MPKTLLFVAATNAIGMRFRCGTGFPKEGTLIDAETWDDDDLVKLRGDPCLAVRDATKADIERFGGVTRVQGNAAEVSTDIRDALIDVIKDLPAEAFTKAGAPRIDDVRKLSDLDDDAITKDQVTAAFKVLTDAGFVVPQVTA